MARPDRRRAALALLGGGAALLLLLGAERALAQSEPWPARTVRLVVAYPPGGSTDVAARLVAERLSSRLGRQVVVENRAGAGGTIGAGSVAKSEPDGYTLLFAASPELTISRITMKSMPYDSARDLQPIALVGQVPFMLVANPAVPAASLAELIAHAKANPGKLSYSSFGNNTSNHLVGELFKLSAGVDAVHVPYKGSSPSITDLIGGQVHYTFDTITAVLPHVRGGRLRAIAMATPQRSALAPGVPTMAESGMPGFTGGTWFGLLAPGRTPRPVVERLQAEVDAILRSPDVRKAFEERGIEPAGGTPQEFAAFIQSEIDKWQRLATQLGIRPE
jgi:tripartite-type tricarboxylate transporter receptor subunit TctC